MRAAVIDIGSNSVKMVIGENVDGEIKILETLKNVTGIGKNTFYNGRISHEIMNKLIAILEKYKNVIREYEVKDVKIIATTAVREAENKDIFLDTILRKTGFEVEVLNVGDVVYYIDAFLSYKLNKTYPIQEKNLIIAELGAGSLDVSILAKGYTLMNLGIPIGTLRLKQFKNRIDASMQETYDALEEYVENQILSAKKSFPKIKIDDLIIIDESYSAAIHKILPSKKREPVFYKFKCKESSQLISKILEISLADISQVFDVSDSIAESLDVYSIILNKLFKLIKQRHIYILETSLSQALLANIILNVELSKKYNKANQLLSVAKFLCRKYNSDVKHVKQVSSLCDVLFKEFRDTLGLSEDDHLYLILAAHLHNIGLFITNRAHHKHTEYIINSSNLFRLTQQEITIIACIARYHRQASPKKAHVLYHSLSQANKILIQKLSSLLRLAHALDSSHKQKVKKLEITSTRKQELLLTVYTSESFALEKVNFLDEKKYFEEVSGNMINLKVKRQG